MQQAIILVYLLCWLEIMQLIQYLTQYAFNGVAIDRALIRAKVQYEGSGINDPVKIVPEYKDIRKPKIKRTSQALFPQWRSAHRRCFSKFRTYYTKES